MPPIVPLLVHHSRKGWTAKTAFQEVVALDEPLRAELWPYIPHFEMRVVDLHEPSPTNLDPGALTAYGKVVLWVLAAAGDEARLRRAFADLGRELGEVARAPDVAALDARCGTLQRRTRACKASRLPRWWRAPQGRRPRRSS